MKNVKYAMVVLILALALIGGAYAAWSEELFITGNVDTAEFDVSFVGGSVVYSLDNDFYGPSVGSEYGTAVGELSDDLKTLTVTLENVYPGYEIYVMADVEVENSIPIQVRLTGPDGNGSVRDITFISNTAPFSATEVGEWIDLSAEWTEGWSVYPRYGVWLEVGDDAVPGDSYAFEFTLQYRQGVGSEASFE